MLAQNPDGDTITAQEFATARQDLTNLLQNPSGYVPEQVAAINERVQLQRQRQRERIARRQQRFAQASNLTGVLSAAPTPLSAGMRKMGNTMVPGLHPTRRETKQWMDDHKRYWDTITAAIDRDYNITTSGVFANGDIGDCRHQMGGNVCVAFTNNLLQGNR